MSTASVTTPAAWQPTTSRYRAARIAARAAGVSAAASVIAIGTAGVMDPGYSHLREGISALASRESHAAPIMIFGFFTMATTLVAAGIALLSALTSRRGRAAAVLIIAAGLLTAASGILRQDCSSQEVACRARESAETVSGSHVLHNLLAIPLFLFLIIASFLLAATLRRALHNRAHARVSLLVGLAALLLMITFGADLAGDLGGLAQRVLVLLVFGWPVYLACNLTEPTRYRSTGQSRQA